MLNRIGLIYEPLDKEQWVSINVRLEISNANKKDINMIKFTPVIVTFLFAATSFAAEAPKPADQKTLYAIGLSVARSLYVFDLTPSELAVVQQGIADAFSGKQPEPGLLSYNQKIQDLALARRKALGEKQTGAGREFLEKSAKEKGARKTASGMIYTSLAEGKGEPPKADDVVKVNYRGTLIDGKEFDSSYKNRRPLEFKLTNVIKCWIEGMQLMKPGGRAKFVCPPALAYGDNGAGELVLPGATLAFEVELLEVKKADLAKSGDAAPATAAAPVKDVK